MTTVLVTQPVYFPPTWWMARVLAADVVVLLDNAQFSRKHQGPGGSGPTWQNCCEIKLPGQPRHRLTVPVSGGRQQLRYTALTEDAWQERHLRTIAMAYAKAPRYAEVMSMIKEIIELPTDNLGALTGTSVVESFFALQDRATIGTYITPHKPEWFRASQLRVPAGVTGTDWMVELTKAVRGTRYLVGQTALANYIDRVQFEGQGIELVPHRYTPVAYPQLHGGDFEPNLSVIDLLMNLEPEEARWALEAE